MRPSNVILILLLSFFAHSTIAQSINNWYQAQRTSDTPYNISVDAVYKELIKDRAGAPVVVAVIDSGVDIEHEDLKDVIWTNSDEIPDNGIDDDQNGYIDDINGWNFIGGPDGSHVAADTYEMTRLYAEYRTKFQDADLTKLSKKEREQYNDYIKWGKRIETEVKNSKEQYDMFEERANLFGSVLDHIEDINEVKPINRDLIDSLSTSFNQLDAIAANIYNFYIDETGNIPEIATLRLDLLGPLEEALHYFGSKWKYGWNPDYDPRHIVGDDYEDLDNRYYGNNSVEGPDAMHGTHVAGIIGASRNNDIGINGIADNVRIMVIRAVPDGDERDKDVANAIRYAVENGASIINMSFGKGASPEKEYVDDAIRFAEKNDVLLVHAAGNSSDDLTTAENYPNDYYKKPKGFLFFKKKQPKNYLSIGASGPSKGEQMAAEFSNYGTKDVDLFAPGVAILSTVPDDLYEEQQGTSMAAPVISGVAAIIRSYFPTLSAPQVKEAIISSAKKDDTLVKKPGTSEYVPFSTLSVSGGIVDVATAFKTAAKMKGKKKMKKSKGKVRA